MKVARSDRTQVAAIVGLFVANGALFGVLAPRLPEFVARLEIGPGLLGWMFGVATAGSLVGSIGAPRLIRRFGLVPTVRVGVMLAAVGAVVALISRSPLWVLIGFTVLGLCDGAADVGTNLAAVEFDRRRLVPLMSRFHAAWTLGVLFFSVVSVATVDVIGLPALGVGVTLAVTAWAAVAAGKLPEPVVIETPHRGRPPHRALTVVATVAAVGIVVEAIPLDWGALAMEERFASGATVSGLAVPIGMIGAMLARLLGDRMMAVAGARRVVSGMMVPAIGGLVLIETAGSEGLALLGFFLVGFGAGMVFPGLMRAASEVEGADAGTAVSFVASAVRVSLMASPPLVGYVAERQGVLVAFWIAAGAGVVVLAWGSWRRS